jgi:hypothetical protein
MTNRRHRARLRGRRRAVLVAAVLTLLLAGAGWAGWVAWLGASVRTDLLAGAGLARQLQHELEQGQVQQAGETLTALQQRTRAARATTTTLSWRVASRVPGLGANFAAVGSVTAALDDLAHEGLPSLLEVAADLDPAALAPRDGRVNLAPLQRAEPRITAADHAVHDARTRVAAVPARGLLPPLRAAIEQLGGELDRAAATTGTARRAATLMPPMLGADGPRTYLVLFQNPAEVRATGGMPGAFAVVRADRGAVRIVHQGTAARDLKTFERPVLPLDPAMRALYTERLGTYPANINLTPHFPTAAALAQEMYRLRSGQTVDGVLATDPVALSYLLRATGPIALPAGALPDGDKLTADNAVRVLLSEVYAEAPSGEAQDGYFAAATVAAFDALVGGRADPRTTIDELARAAGERRTLLWSARPAEQRLISGTVLAGELPTDDGEHPVVGVFLNDGSGAKLGYYLTQAAEVSVGERRADGRCEIRVRVTLGSTAPARGLPASVLGMGLAGDPYTVRTHVSIFSPAGGALERVRLDGAPASVGTGIERDRAVGIITVDLAPGTSRTVEATLLTAALPANREPDARLWVTPAVTPWTESSG